MKKIVICTAILAVIGIVFVGGGKIALGQNYSAEIDNQFVYMRNDKFHYKTEEFYLKTCNYLIDMFIDDNDELVVTPSINYFDKYGNALWGDITLPENQLDADKYFKAHFTALKKMGFNSVRIMGCQVERRWDSDILTTRLYFKNHEQGQVNPDPASNDNTYGIRDWEILTDLESENGKEFYLQAMHVVLDAAQECGLKVVWVMGWEYQYVDVNDNKTWRSLLTPPNHTINQQFCSFLHDVATEFKDNTTLICYDLFNELLSFDGEYGCSDTFQLSHSVKELVASIKATDKNHAITVGLHSISEFFHLGVEPFKHCDVYSFHIYEGNYSNHSALIGQITNRQLYYFNKTIPFPWMIGETGSNTSENTESELVQRDYAYITQQQSINCNSLGYSWWQFYDNAPGAGENRLGLLRCDGGTENVVLNEDENNSVNIYGDYKKIVDYNNQGTAGLNISIFNCGFSQNSCEFLSNPYDYYMYPHIADNVSTHKWKGKVMSGDIAIKDAVVKVSVNYPDLDGSLVDFFTFTKIDGTYEIDIPTTDYTASITVAKYGYATSAAKKNIPNWITGVIPTSFDIVPSVLPTKENYNVNYIVSEGIPRTITKPTMIKKDIIVNNNTSLTISASVFLDDNSKIKVLPGGKLILEDGAVLSAIHQNWQGIEVTGTTGNPAEIHTSGDNIIAKAVLGITSENNVIIDINNTKFINNNNDIIATGNALPIQINNALFTTTEQANEEITGYYTCFSECDDVKIMNTKYLDNRAQASNSVKKTGVLGNLSNIFVTTTGKTRNSFSGMKFAISVEQCDLDVVHTDFFDNMHDIDMGYGHGINLFTDCTFVVNNGYPVDDDAYNYFVHFRECEYVHVSHCNFSDNSAEAVISPLKFGIQVENVGNLKVTPDALISLRRTSFNNLNYGIYAVRGIFSFCKILVKQTDFKTSRGIYLSNYASFGSAKLINNNIVVKNLPNLRLPNLRAQGDGTQPNPAPDPYDPTPDEMRPYGIYIDGISNDYQVEGNSITSENGVSDNKYGVVIRNNGSYTNELYRNNISSLENSVQAIGNNRKQVDGNSDGLQILCNKFNSNKTDIYVTECNESSNWGIAGKQGNLSQPAGNLFSCYGNNIDNHCPVPVINNDLNEFTYYTRSLSDPNFNYMELPGNVGDNVHVTPITITDLDEFCLNNVIDNGLHINTDEIYSDLLISFTLENSINQMLDDIVDGGSTGQVLSNIIHLDDNSAWITYYDLMFKSPYLSDTVLKDIAKKETGLTIPMIRDILVANPQSAKKSDVKKLLKERDVLLPDYMIEQIEAGEVYISSKEYLELQKFEQRIEFEKALFTLANYYYNSKDSLSYAHDSLVSLFNIRKEPKYLYLLADYYVDNFEYSEAKEVLNSMYSVCELTDIEKTEIEDLISFINFYQNLIKLTKDDLYNLNDFYIEQLKVYEEKGGIAGSKASQLLYLNNVIYKLEKIYKPSVSIGTRSFRIGGEFNPSNPTFAIYPNPADDYLTVDYKLAEQKGALSIIIVDITGKPVYTKQLNSIEDIVLINLKDILPGAYVCSLFNGNDCDFSEKFVINK